MTDQRSKAADERGDTAAHIAAIRQHGVLIVLILVAAVAAVAAYVTLTPRHYKSEADILVTPVSPDDDALTGLGLLLDPAGSVFTTGKVLESPQITDRVKRHFGLKLSGLNSAELLAKVQITPLPQSNLVTIRATERSPRAAAALANAFATALIAERTEVFQTRLKAAVSRLQSRRNLLERTRPGEGRLLDDRLAAMRSFEGAQDPTLHVWSAAQPPDTAAPRPTLALAAAFIAALLLAGGAALALELFDPRIHRRSAALRELNVLARVPLVSRKALRKCLAGRGVLPAQLWDAWRLVRSRLAAGRSDGELPASVLVTSPGQGEGKTTAAVCLAVTIAATGSRVVLVDGNLRDPQVAALFGVEVDEGLVEVLEGRIATGNALVSVPEVGGLRLLPAGSQPERGIDLLEQRRLEELLTELKSEADVVIIDSPALREFAEAATLGRVADVVLGVVLSSHTRVANLNELVTVLDRHGIPLAGLVVHRRRRARGRGVPTPVFRHPSLAREPSPLRTEVA